MDNLSRQSNCVKALVVFIKGSVPGKAILRLLHHLKFSEDQSFLDFFYSQTAPEDYHNCMTETSYCFKSASYYFGLQHCDETHFFLRHTIANKRL